MDTYITGAVIRSLREARGMTQAQLADRLCVSSKTVSKWETARGLPDISLIEPLSRTLGVSVLELMAGAPIVNRNVQANILRSRFFVCPICGNILQATGDAVVSCCGITLPPLEAEEIDEAHSVTLEPVEDEQLITVHHPMTKAHYISFIALVSCDRTQFVKLYPEGSAQTRLQVRGRGILYLYCNHHGLMMRRI